MLLTITTTYQPATDLGYLLVKKPDRVHSRTVSFGEAHVFYPEASDERCTAALLLEVDSLKLVRGGKNKGERTLAHYVNDRPYVASSFLRKGARSWPTRRSRWKPGCPPCPAAVERAF
jgi:hypothetical protein